MPPERARGRRVKASGWESRSPNRPARKEEEGKGGYERSLSQVTLPESARSRLVHQVRARFDSEPGGFLNRRSGACRDARSGAAEWMGGDGRNG